MTWDKKIAALGSVLGTVVIKLLGGWDMLIYALLLFMALDYGTGIYRAYKDKELSSEIGINGIAKKITILVVVAVAVGIDLVTGTQGAIRTLSILWYIVMEGISILENAVRIGITVPDKLSDALLQLKENGKKAEPTIVRTVNQATTETIDGITTESSKETITATSSKEE